MRPADDSPYHVAATLALDMIEARPNLNDDTAACIAWETWKNAEAQGPNAKFQGPYSNEVMRAMQDIRSGRLNRIEHSPSALEKALEQLDR
jgi:hypothetical protein